MGELYRFNPATSRYEPADAVRRKPREMPPSRSLHASPGVVRKRPTKRQSPGRLLASASLPARYVLVSLILIFSLAAIYEESTHQAPTAIQRALPLLPPSAPRIAAPLVAETPAVIPGRAAPSGALMVAEARPTVIPAMLGSMSLGSFSGEAMDSVGLSNHSYVDIVSQYAKLRRAMHDIYGADLQDMNYYGCGLKGWQDRQRALREWMLMAGKFGDVQLALEPQTGVKAYSQFSDADLEMRGLKQVLADASNQGITVYVRFASENNLENSPFTVLHDRQRCFAFYHAAAWFKKVMPPNVRLVYSPLINTATWGGPSQQRILRWCLLGPDGDTSIWSRIGGTLYLTDWDLTRTYARYYDYMSTLSPDTPFQLCELGGPVNRKIAMLRFIHELKEGMWPRVVHVNLFAYKINTLADPAGCFGFLSKGSSESYLKSEIEHDSMQAL